MASKFTIHNGLESNDVNSPINVTTGLEVGGLSFPSLTGVVRYVDEASIAGVGANGRTKAQAFTSIQDAVDAAAPEDRAAMQALLAETGLADLLTLRTLRRVERKGHLEVWSAPLPSSTSAR